MFEGDDSILEHFHGATLEEGGLVCEACLFEVLQEASCGCPDLQQEAEYRGRKVKLNKVMRGDVKKFKVFVKDPKTGNIKKVNFGHGGTSAKKRGEKTMKIKKSDPKRRKSFRARHNCDNPGPKTKARYWSCRMWKSNMKVGDLVKIIPSKYNKYIQNIILEKELIGIVVGI